MNPTLKGFLRKELTQALRDTRMRIVLFLVPMFQMNIFGFAISTEVRNIRLAAVHAPGDTLSRELAKRAYATGWFVPVDTAGGDPYELIRSGRADAVLVAPRGGTLRALGRGKREIQLLIDATNVIRAQSIENYLTSIAGQVLAGRNALLPLPAIRFDVRVLYNPSMTSATFLVPGVMSLILSVTAIILTSMSIAREREMGTFEMILSAPVSRTEVLLGKTMPFVFLGLVDVVLILGVAMFVFGVPMRGGFGEFALAALVFVLSAVSIGTLISTFAENQQQAMMGGFIFLFIATLLSGMFFPIDTMPVILQVISSLNPQRYFVTLLRNIMLKGGESDIVWRNIGEMALVGMGAMTLAFKRFRATLG